MALTAFALEMVALWFQHVMLLQPCVLCIYERCALFGIMGAGLVGAIAPKSPLRYAGIAIWLYSAWKGIELSWQHTMMQLHPSPFRPVISPPASRAGCRWINGCRRCLSRPVTAPFVSGNS
jgi:disulfide bond formation protein DsbB